MYSSGGYRTCQLFCAVPRQELVLRCSFQVSCSFSFVRFFQSFLSLWLFAPAQSAFSPRTLSSASPFARYWRAVSGSPQFCWLVLRSTCCGMKVLFTPFNLKCLPSDHTGTFSYALRYFRFLFPWYLLLLRVASRSIPSAIYKMSWRWWLTYWASQCVFCPAGSPWTSASSL